MLLETLGSGVRTSQGSNRLEELRNAGVVEDTMLHADCKLQS